jgi:hypothetical protein
MTGKRERTVRRGREIVFQSLYMRLLVRRCKKKGCVGHLIAGLAHAACEKPVPEPEKDEQRRARCGIIGSRR